jgi:hypothetical protein
MTAGVVEMATPAELANFPRPDPSRGFLILCVGVKESGKSTAARETYLRLSHIDRLCIDPTGDADPGEDAEVLSDPLPSSWPWSLSKEPRNLLYRPHAGDDDFVDKMDAALGIALFPKDHPVVVWVDEAGLLCPTANSAKPNLRTLLISLRHYGPCSVILCTPRPKKIDTLMISQADLIYIYALPAYKDRETLAENMGFPIKVFEAAHAELVARGDYWFLLYQQKGRRLWLCPPLPYTPPSKPTEHAKPLM